jgi:hypothetical protein
MPILIEYKCQNCLATIEWVFEPNDGLSPSDVRGCPSEGCTELHKLSVTEINERDDTEIGSGD